MLRCHVMAQGSTSNRSTSPSDATVAIEAAFVFQAPEGARPIWQEFNPGPSRFRRSLKLRAGLDASKNGGSVSKGLTSLSSVAVAGTGIEYNQACVRARPTLLHHLWAIACL